MRSIFMRFITVLILCGSCVALRAGFFPGEIKVVLAPGDYKKLCKGVSEEVSRRTKQCGIVFAGCAMIASGINLIHEALHARKSNVPQGQNSQNEPAWRDIPLTPVLAGAALLGTGLGFIFKSDRLVEVFS